LWAEKLDWGPAGPAPDWVSLFPIAVTTLCGLGLLGCRRHMESPLGKGRAERAGLAARGGWIRAPGLCFGRAGPGGGASRTDRHTESSVATSSQSFQQGWAAGKRFFGTRFFWCFAVCQALFPPFPICRDLHHFVDRDVGYMNMSYSLCLNDLPLILQTFSN
jgi:hypothetical protein